MSMSGGASLIVFAPVRSASRRELVESLEAADETPPRARLLRRNAAGVYAATGERPAHERDTGDDDVVADRDVADDTGAAADHAALADHDAAGDADACRHRGVRADVAVVADLNLIVELHTVL